MYRFTSIARLNPDHGVTEEIIELHEGTNCIDSEFASTFHVLQAFMDSARHPNFASVHDVPQAFMDARGRRTIRLTTTGDLHPDVPWWLMNLAPRYRGTMPSGHEWPPLEEFLDSPTGRAIDKAALCEEIATRLLQRYRREIDARETKFMRVTGFNVRIESGGLLEISDSATGQPLNGYFESYDDKYRLYLQLNKSVRAVVGDKFDVPLVLHGVIGWVRGDPRAEHLRSSGFMTRVAGQVILVS